MLANIEQITLRVRNKKSNPDQTLTLLQPNLNPRLRNLFMTAMFVLYVLIVLCRLKMQQPSIMMKH